MCERFASELGTTLAPTAPTPSVPLEGFHHDPVAMDLNDRGMVPANLAGQCSSSIPVALAVSLDEADPTRAVPVSPAFDPGVVPRSHLMGRNAP